jgi:hypothetical protein
MKPTVKVNKQKTTFNSYAEIKRNMKLLLDRSLINNVIAQVTVLRLKRGKTGEWFEVWQYNKNNKPVIINKGWM